MNLLNLSALFTIECWLGVVMAGSVVSALGLPLLYGLVFPIFSSEFLASCLVSAAIWTIFLEKYVSDSEMKIQLNMLSRFFLADAFVVLMLKHCPKGQSFRFR
ncbi:hypothetical protein EBZ37_08450 [bacterium]|nr:hypothetical protein [bacterium]